MNTNIQLQKYLQELTILCVDDASSIREAYKYILRRYFKEVYLAADGMEALEVFEKQKPDLVLTDYLMPHMDGLALIKRIRKNDRNIPVILVTAMKESEILKEALNINTTHFLNKPIEKETLLNVLYSAAKSFLADVMLQKERENKIKTLEASREYTKAQERMAFEKELHIIRNDRYLELAAEARDESYLCLDVCYRPLDVLSGDSFSVREIDEHKDLYFIIDAMGKGVAASTTAMLSTSYLNHAVDMAKIDNSFHLQSFIRGYIDYIQKFLLDEEMLSLIVVVFDRQKEVFEIANFAMPPVMVINAAGSFEKIMGQNLPISKYLEHFETDTRDLRGFKKLLFSSDGIYETVTKAGDLSYKYLKDDFYASSFAFEFERRFFERVQLQDDDVTFLMLTRADLQSSSLKEFTVLASLNEVKAANEKIIKFIKTFFSPDRAQLAKLQYAFYELLFNAYEHGSLGVSGSQKQHYIEKDRYTQYLQSLETTVFSMIYVKLYYYNNYVIIKIKDEGRGFDLGRVRMEFIVDSMKFSGRGIKSAKTMLDSLFYNFKSNEVMLIKNIKGDK
ncbi:MAG: response regulator [Campylobacterota bacterium]